MWSYFTDKKGLKPSSKIFNTTTKGSVSFALHIPSFLKPYIGFVF